MDDTVTSCLYFHCLFHPAQSSRVLVFFPCPSVPVLAGGWWRYAREVCGREHHIWLQTGVSWSGSAYLGQQSAVGLLARLGPVMSTVTSPHWPTGGALTLCQWLVIRIHPAHRTLTTFQDWCLSLSSTRTHMYRPDSIIGLCINQLNPVICCHFQRYSYSIIQLDGQLHEEIVK